MLPEIDTRFDICEAHYMFAVLYHGGGSCPIYGKFSQLHRMQFKPSPMLSVESLTEQGKDIFDTLIEKHGFDPYVEQGWTGVDPWS